VVFERRVPIFKGKKAKKNTGRKSSGFGYHSKLKKREHFIAFLKKYTIYAIIAGSALLTLLLIYLFFLARSLPDVRIIANIVPNETTKIYSVDNIVLAELHQEENRITVPYSKISNTMKVAVVALEDARFYRHHGIDPIGIFRAVVVNIIKGGKVQGASTITQQLARHLFLTKRKKFSRKIAEMILALKIERHYTKEEILNMYLNQVYWGHNSYGIESATQQYFHRNASDLSVAESAMLVGMLQAPEYYSPYRNYERTMNRKNIVLKRMFDIKLLTRQEYLNAKAEEIIIAPRKKVKYKAPYFTQEVIKVLIDLYGEEEAYNGGLKVYAPINWEMQNAAEEAVDWAISRSVQLSLNFSQAAMLAIDPRTGYVITMVGGHDFLNNQFNKTLQSHRQPGSAFKPFVYLTALSKKFSPGTIFEDSAVTFNTLEGPYSPKNYGLKYAGRMPMRKALEKSKNVIAIKMVDLVTPESVVDTARKFGITAPLKPVLSIALGSQEVSMLELVFAYGGLATGGNISKPILIKKIEDRNGVVLYKSRIETKRVFNSNLVYALVEMMKGVVNYGTARNAKLPRPIAGKTGTTTDYRDAWFIGFVPQIVCAAWVGNDDNTPMNRVTGGWIPALMWKQYMKTALKNVPRLDFPSPSGLVNVDMCWQDGKKYNGEAGKHTVEKYWVGYEPKEFSTIKPNSETQSTSKADNGSDKWLNDFLN